MSSSTFKPALAELIGTFLLVFFGTGAIIVDSLYNGIIGHLGVSITFGLVVLAVIYAIGEISGAHLNPAVSIAFFVAKRISFHQTVFFCVFQVIGAILASLILSIIFPESLTLGETLPSGTILQSFVMEFILSFALMFVIINVATGSKEQGVAAGLAIGMTVLICALIGGPISGASMNPARSIAPALISLKLQHLWIYIVSTVLGTITSVIVWKCVK